jgi:hypothetical protein
MSEIAEPAGRRRSATAIAHESYSFACLRCGHGWEQSYEIEHHTDLDGNQFVRYVADGRVVPSPLSEPTCENCDGHVVRIMRAGRVSSAVSCLYEHEYEHRTVLPPASASPPGEEAAARKQETHWHLSDLWHSFHRKDD